MHFRFARLALISIAVFACLGATAWACPSCKAALGGDPAQANLVNGFFWSILFMMSMPFVILGTFGGSMYLSVRRASKRAERPTEVQPTVDDRARSSERELVDV